MVKMVGCTLQGKVDILTTELSILLIWLEERLKEHCCKQLTTMITYLCLVTTSPLIYWHVRLDMLFLCWSLVSSYLLDNTFSRLFSSVFWHEVVICVWFPSVSFESCLLYSCVHAVFLHKHINWYIANSLGLHENHCVNCWLARLIISFLSSDHTKNTIVELFQNRKSNGTCLLLVQSTEKGLRA